MSKREASKVPTIRFKGFAGEWEPHELGEITTKIGSGKTPRGGKTGYLSTGIPLIRSQNILNDLVNFEGVAFISDETDEEMSNSRVLQNDVLLNITGASIGRSAVYRASERANVNQHVCIIRANGNHYSDFIQVNLVSARGQAAINNSQAGGAREGLNFQQIAKFDFHFPSHAEQAKIGSYFRRLDQLILQHQHKHDKLVTLKLAMLQNMFPQPGATAPKIRFKGFEREWKKETVSSLLTERNIQFPKSRQYPLMAFIAGQGVAPKGKRYNREFLVSDELNKKYKRTELGDFIYSSNNLETGSIGTNKYGSASISPVYSIFSPTPDSDSNFIEQLLCQKEFINEMVKWRQGVVYGQWRIHESDFLKIEVTFPSFGEQQKIGNYFRQLDELISHHATQLEKLKQVKAASLEKMFV